MLDLSAIKTLLVAGAPSLGQVILPDAVDVQGPDSAALLVTLAGAQVSSRIYPLILPDAPTYPAIAYQRLSAVRAAVDDYPVFRDETYALTLWHGTYGTAHSTAALVRDALQDYSPSAAAGTVDIVDESDDYAPELNDGAGLYASNIVVSMTHLARATQTLPAAYVYPIGTDWEPGESVTCVDGIDAATFAVLLVAKIPVTGVSGLESLRAEIRSAIVAEEVGAWGPIEPAGGALQAVHSSFAVWRDLFVARQIRTYA